MFLKYINRTEKVFFGCFCLNLFKVVFSVCGLFLAMMGFDDIWLCYRAF